MKILMLFIFLSAVFAETDTAEVLKSETDDGKKQELEVEDMEIVEISETKPKPKKDEISEKPSQTIEKSTVEASTESKQIEPIVEEISETAVVSTVEAPAEVSAVSGVKYVCNEGRSYTFYEPGSDPNHLCELDAGHTEQPADWYALNDSSFCKGKMEELISQYNCVQETK